eukprot:6252376-Pyramimonas_sp.AAC.1
MESATAMIAEHKEKFTIAEHWEQRPKKRDLNNAISRIQGLARKCGAKTTNHTLQDLSCKLSDLAEVLETRHSVLEKIRSNFKDVVLGKDTDIQRNQ